MRARFDSFMAPAPASSWRDARVTTTLLAQCSNCAAWREQPALGGHVSTDGQGYCSRGLLPDEGKLLCGQYRASPAFQQRIIGTMLREEGPMAMPVRLVGGRRSARRHRRG